MTQRDRRAAALIAALLAFGPASLLAQERPRPPVVEESPGGTRLLEGGAILQVERPTFAWQPPREAAAGAVLYTVRVLPVEGPNQLGPPVWEQAGLKTPSVVYAGPPLDPQRAYVWTMEAIDAKGRLVAADGSSFARTSSFGFLDFCIPFVFPSANKICKGQPVTVWAALFSFQSGTTTYVLSDGVNPPTSGTWPGSITLTPAVTTTYTLTLKRGSCQAGSQFTITVVDPPSLGPATCSPAASQSDPPNWSQTVNVCCGSGLKCKVDNPVGNVQWFSEPPVGHQVTGATGAAVNVNPGQLACNPSTPTLTLFHAEASTDPVCPTVQSNPVAVTTYPPPQLGSLTVSKPVICADGVSTSQINLTGSVGTVTWTKQPGCIGPPLPAGPTPITIGPLTQKECYTVTVTSGPCPPITQTVTIDVDLKPVAGTITAAPNPICPGDDSILTLTGSGGIVQWYSSTGCTPPTVFANPMPGATGNTMQNTNILQQTTCYGVQVSSLLGVCPPVQGPIAQVTVQSLPQTPVITGPQILCPGQAVTLSSSIPGQWSWNGDSVGVPNSSTLNVNDPGNYWITATNVCGSADSNILTVKPDLLTVKIQGPCCDCSGGKVQLCAMAAQGVGATSLAWSTGATSSCIQVKPATTTTYTVTATDAAGCAVSTSFIVTVCP
jgi:hypothetical protein